MFCKFKLGGLKNKEMAKMSEPKGGRNNTGLKKTEN